MEVHLLKLLLYTHLLVAPVTAFARQLGSSAAAAAAGFSQMEGSCEWRRGTIDTVEVHGHAARARWTSFAARSGLPTCLTSVNALFCSPAFFSAVSTRSRVVASSFIVPAARTSLHSSPYETNRGRTLCQPRMRGLKHARRVTNKSLCTPIQF
jgi:hypothetical protein